MHMAPDIQLPSLPEVTLRALEACHQDANYRTITDIVSNDTALVTRILALANSALYGPATRIRSIDQALLRLGTRRFHTLVLTAALRQLLFELGGDEWQQLRDFWRHSLTTALTARALATLTSYPEPDEAFMLGMVHNIGELIAIKTREPETKQYYFTHQADLAANLVTAWGLGPMAADALRYQQALPNELRDAGHLVKVISLATRLALNDASGIAAAGTVFGLSEELTREIRRRIDHEVAGTAASLGIPLDETYDGEDATRKLRQAILSQAMASQAIGLADLAGGRQDILAETVASLTLVTGYPALCFGPVEQSLVLLSGSCGPMPELSVTSTRGGSVLTEAFHTHQPLALGERSPTVLDRQLLSLLHTPSLLAIPVVIGTDCPGVFVLGTETSPGPATLERATLFAQQLGRVLAPRQNDCETMPDSDRLRQELEREQLRRQVHEISNPLTIIRQYIYQLRGRLEDTDLQRELDVIRDELDRAGNLLLQMSHSDTPARTDQGVELNEELRSLARILEDTLFSRDNRQLRLALCPAPTTIRGKASSIRQVALNLLRNAAEALPPDGGQVTIRTSAPIWQNHRTWVELEISDTGPGIPEHLRERLFMPVSSTKGEGHSGLGLSIVKQLIDDMEGIVACRTSQEGTTFRILFPAATRNDNETD
ncbi:HDOD domain-containing protein [uncultured Marinobacter sp.]|uniref:HDOD domain-containing protein n=1 Tax=uncultured Marinobacter sp. TaxID=187379 RepID=UPI000C5503C1|nr:histidine kinase [Oceanospirillales bacterium]|tara:strand:- start:4391 stop:6373 length:1983 start_codon:yes stop_codon:yes gene_type:complete